MDDIFKEYREFSAYEESPTEYLDHTVSYEQRYCGDCYHFMKSNECPREMNVDGFNRGPSINSRACEKWEPESRYKIPPAPEGEQA